MIISTKHAAQAQPGNSDNESDSSIVFYPTIKGNIYREEPKPTSDPESQADTETEDEKHEVVTDQTDKNAEVWDYDYENLRTLYRNYTMYEGLETTLLAFLDTTCKIIPTASATMYEVAGTDDDSEVSNHISPDDLAKVIFRLHQIILKFNMEDDVRECFKATCDEVRSRLEPADDEYLYTSDPFDDDEE